ncbi:unnamed protein product [Amoebophrya sp. A120]|nr:unnamed protein product [Amoebophrya sp. A120]|eukprot:GSA120T00015156001.1
MLQNVNSLMMPVPARGERSFFCCSVALAAGTKLLIEHLRAWGRQCLTVARIRGQLYYNLHRSSLVYQSKKPIVTAGLTSATYFKSPFGCSVWQTKTLLVRMELLTSSAKN